MAEPRTARWRDGTRSFLVNRAGEILPAARTKILRNAMAEPRKLYGKMPRTKKKAA